MKLFIRLIVLSGLVFVLFSSTDKLFDLFIVDNVYAESVSSLIAVASIIGFLLFIIFTYFVEYAELRHLIYYHKVLSKWITISYTVLSILALIVTIVNFDFRRAVMISIIYLAVTIAYDYLRERIMLIRDMSRTHPKTII